MLWRMRATAEEARRSTLRLEVGGCRKLRRAYGDKFVRRRRDWKRGSQQSRNCVFVKDLFLWLIEGLFVERVSWRRDRVVMTCPQ